MASTSKKSTARSAWIKHTENKTGVVGAKNHAEAEKTFARLSAREQYHLAREMAQARQVDFVNQIGNVVALTVGNKRSQGKLSDEACVVFFVKKKWKSDKPDSAQSLPKHLFTYINTAAGRSLCAVPTDVRPIDVISSARAQFSNGVEVSGYNGTLCWPVLLDEPGVFAIAPFHVMTADLSSSARTTPAKSMMFDRPYGKQAIGKGTDRAGMFQPASKGESLDVQIAKIDKEIARKLFRGLRLSKQKPYAEDFAEIKELADNGLVYLMVPDNRTGYQAVPGGILAKFSNEVHSDTTIAYRDNKDSIFSVANRSLMQLDLGNEVSQPGDSGSPVVAKLQDGTHCLVGMHIAGNPDENASFAIPAWLLLDSLQYANPTPQGIHLMTSV